MRKRTSVIDNHHLLAEVKEKLGMTQKEITEAAMKFQRYDERQCGFVVKHEVDDVLRDLNLLKNPRAAKHMAQELNSFKEKELSFKQVCELICRVQSYIEQMEDEESITGEYLDAFVSLGGNYDRTGVIRKDLIVKTIKSEFELTFDMAKLLEEIGNNNELTFIEFCQVFDNAGDDAKSVITSITERLRRINDDENGDFKVKYKDFEIWMQSMNNTKTQQRSPIQSTIEI